MERPLATGMESDLLSSYAGLLFLASASVYIGSYASLPKGRKSSGGVADDDEEEDTVERITTEDAYWFPIIGSVVLFGLYLIVTKLGPEWINLILRWYTSITGAFSVWKASVSFCRYAVGTARWKECRRYDVSLKITKGADPLQLSWRTPTMLLLPLSCLPSVLYNVTKFGQQSALLSNILALSFCYSGLALIKLDSFATGCVLLSGLFLYDVWWVFGTEVMVKVATTLDVPIKLLWPKSMILSPANGFTMLGLGDVVVPGTFIALALRYDYSHHQKGAVGRPETPFFHATLGAYMASLATTMAVMHVWKTGQPALLYISPSIILTTIGTALVRGEFGELWSWEDGGEEPKAEQKTQGVKDAIQSAKD